MKGRYILAVSSLIQVIILVLVINIAYGSTSKKIEEEKEELESIRHKIEEKRRQRLNVEKREGSILSKIEDMDYKLGKKEAFLHAIDLSLSEKDKDVERLEAETKRLKTDLIIGKKRVSERLKRMYKEGRLISLKIIFSATDHIDLLKRYYYIKWLHKKDLDVIKRYEQVLKELEGKGNQLEQVRSEMWKTKNEVTNLMKDIESNRRQKESLLTKVRLERASYDKTILELEEEASDLQSLIKELEARKTKKGGSLGFVSKKGRLDWPIDGRIISHFGRQKHPRFGTYIYKKGLEIRSFHGDKIRAIYNGTVVFAGWFRGYGQLIILDHGDNYFSLYAYAARLLVSVGDKVKKDQVVGEIGDTGLSDGNDLYFELRHGANPIDPILWLKNRGRGVLLGERDE